MATEDQKAHTDHPMRHWDRTCPACVAEAEKPVAWRNAAIRLGEELSSVGPDRYYDMTAEQWLDWALAQEPRGKNSLPAPPKRQWVGLTDNEIKKVFEADWNRPNCPEWLVEFSKKIEAKLKEKNT